MTYRRSTTAAILFGWLIVLQPTIPLNAQGDIDQHSTANSINFNTQIRPILSDRCFHCHGPDSGNQDSDLRLDAKERALADLGGYFAIVPGDLGDSELHRRIHSSDENEVMPPPDSNRSLTDSEIALLDEWIRQGAPFDDHWSLVAPVRPPLPKIDQTDWPRNAIDHFILHRLEENGLTPSREAGRSTLLRRVTLDLTGLPPTPEEVDQFLQDDSDDAYEKVVNRLLASPHYGERMALPWLDAARYADSAGYQNDFKRSQWPWRDWVIRALNANMSFDQFSIEQLAGDLLPNPTEDQLLATAFNRNHRINNEGGIIPQEFLVEYVADRVETTGTVWLGMTIGCARCHDHKYDPISQQDFYRLFAFFHNVPEKGKDGSIAPAPNMPVYKSGAKQKHESLKTQLQAARKAKQQRSKNNEGALNQWLDSEHAAAIELDAYVDLPPAHTYYPLDVKVGNTFANLGTSSSNKRRRTAKIGGERGRVVLANEGKHGKSTSIRQGGFLNLGAIEGNEGFVSDTEYTWAVWVKAGKEVSSVEGPIFSCMTPDPKRRGYQINLVDPGDGEPYHVAFRCFSDRERDEGIEVIAKHAVPRNKLTHVAVTYDGSAGAAGVAIYLDGENASIEITNDNFQLGDVVNEELLVGAETESSVDRGVRDELLANSNIDDIRVYREQLDAKQVAALYAMSPVQAILSSKNEAEAAKSFLAQTFSEFHDPEYQTLVKELTNLQAKFEQFEKENITLVSIMDEMETPRETYILIRGAYDAPDESEKLGPATPEAVLPFDERFPRNRLGLAQWLFDDDNPLVARVAVNRIWQSYFGTGLVKTSEDFGSQGDPPTHPQLLDWLAVEFRESGWNMKAMHKQIVMSATYRQSSVITPELLRRDPDNRLLGRGARFRLYAHAIRDQALAASGLLADQRGGPPVMPYQPEGLWDEVSAKGFKYAVGDNEDVYRRSLYTFWRRTVPPPSMMNFDTTAREVCSVTQSRTNTPLQAMNLLNDPTYVEAARALAQRMIKEGGSSADSQISYGMKLLLGDEPAPRVLSVLRRGHARYLEHYRANPKAAEQLLSVGQSSPDESIDKIQLAATAAVASVMLNLDVAVTKQ